MRVLVCGGRDYDDQETVFAWLRPMRARITVLIEGGARGADSLARHWAVMNDVPVETYKADWEEHGKSAGPIRNRVMLKEGKPDVVQWRTETLWISCARNRDECAERLLFQKQSKPKSEGNHHH